MTYTFDYFISYRRACGGKLSALLIKGILCKYGKRVFLDLDDMVMGNYHHQLETVISKSETVILILNEDSWRSQEIDTYYKEIIQAAKEHKNILPVEFADNILCNVPECLKKALGDDYALDNNHKIKFEHQTFEQDLCRVLRLTYSPETEIENLPHFSMPFKIDVDDLIVRDEKVDDLCEKIIQHSIFNLVGIGGCGKTTLSYLLTDRYKTQFSNIAYVVVNGNIKEDFVAQINATLNFDFAHNIPIDDKYNALISFMDQYQTGNNLLILDVNETADKTAIEDYAKKLKNNNLPTTKIYPNGWNILILSREKFGDFHNEDISDDEDKAFLKELFLKKTGDRYNAFEDFDGLLDTIFYSPLLVEQLGIFLKIQPKTKTLAEIKDIFHADKFRKKDRAGVSAYNRNEKETTIINFLNNLIDFESFTPDEQELLRHFVLWKSEYIQYDIIDDLLQGICKDLEETLSNLYDRSHLEFRRNQISIQTPRFVGRLVARTDF